MKKLLIQITVAAILVAGAVAAVQFGMHEEDAHDDHAGHDHGPDEHGPDEHGGDTDDAPASDAASVLSEQALRNLGVTVREVDLSDFVLTVRVQATVVDGPLNTRPVATALGGVVTELHTSPGRRVRPGDKLVTLARAAIPRPELTITGALLPSLSEDLHGAVSACRNAATQVDIVKRELARVREFTTTGTADGLPILPFKTEIDLEYDLARAEQELSNARREVGVHGLSPEEIDTMPSGAEGGTFKTPTNDVLWKRALQVNGFWSEREDRVLAALPERLRRVPWLIGALGELVASGRSSEALETAVRETPALADHLVEAVSLLLAGHSVARVRLLAEQGELEPLVAIRAPSGPPDWDVETVDVRPGQRLGEGAVLAVLHDARSMWMRVEPIGGEVGAVTRAYGARTPMTATPLLEAAGPFLEGLVIDRLTTRGAQHERGSVAFVVCRNEPIVLEGEHDGRTWGLREGLQYVLQVPSASLEQRFVLPAEAVVQQGMERVVLLRDGDAFVPRPVHVEYEDEDVAVIADDGSISRGDSVAVTGAFALSLSLVGDTKADPHAGHNHE